MVGRLMAHQFSGAVRSVLAAMPVPLPPTGWLFARPASSTSPGAAPTPGAVRAQQVAQIVRFAHCELRLRLAALAKR